MKGKIILQNISSPVEGGMKVVYENEIYTVKSTLFLEYLRVFLNSHHNFHFEVKDLKQIAVEHEEPPLETDGGFVAVGNLRTIIPLHPDDYERAVGLIGQEVEFISEPTDWKEWYENATGGYIAKLSLPTQEETWDDIMEEYITFRQNSKSTISYDDWLKQHYLPPRKK